MDEQKVEEDGVVVPSRDWVKIKKQIAKITFVLFMLAGFTIAMVFIFDAFGFNLFGDGIDEEMFESQGIILAVIFVSIYFAQAMTLNLIPGTTTFFITVVAASMFPSFLHAFIVSVIAVLIGSIGLYFLGRYGGRKLLYWLFDKEALDKRLAWFERNGAKGVPWLFLIPMFPTDLLCLTCGAAKMRFWQFILIVVIFRPIEVTLLLVYELILSSEMVQGMYPWQQILVVNVLVINVVLLVIYHKALIQFFNRTFNPRRYEQLRQEEIEMKHEKEIQALKRKLAIIEKRVQSHADGDEKSIGQSDV